MPSHFRQERITSIIKDFSGLFISRVIGGGVFASVTEVETTNDLMEATIFISVFPEDKGPMAISKLKKELGRLRTELSDKGGLSNPPHLDIELSKVDIA
jgi:ribosome-binding factor A